MRTSDAAIAGGLLLAACQPSGGAQGERSSSAAGRPAAVAASDDRLWCARGSAPLARACTVERDADPRGADKGATTLTVRFPDGGFRRLRVARDGRGVVVADGAEPVRVALAGAANPSGEVDLAVSVGDDRVQLPARLRAGSDRAAR